MNSDENPEGVTRLEAGMPPLHVQGTLRSKRELGHRLGVSAPSESKGRRVVDGFVRLSDKATCEYQECRQSLLVYIQLGNADSLHRAQDHFESCIQALHRAINFLERLRSLGYSWETGQPVVAKPRDVEILRDTVKSQVRTFRDFIEHIENDIVSDKVPIDRPAFVHLGFERATINTAHLDYKDVMRWCSQLHYLAMPLAVVTGSASK